MARRAEVTAPARAAAPTALPDLTVGTVEVEDEFEIRRPVGEVFDFVSDHEHQPAWTLGVKRVKRTSPGPVGVGTTYRVVGKMLGRRVESTYEVTAYEPDRCFSGRMTSPQLSFEETFHFEEGDGGGTVVRLRAHAQPGGALRLLGPLLGPAMQRQVRADHRRLRSVLERSPGARARTGPSTGPSTEEHEPAEPGPEEDGGEGDAGE